ncbi:MAG: 3-oxoacyl-ACP reductase FabG [Actinomycetota bacterium]|nr:3-oxoacyl-ACP reductase FabG [Actinomycetota bacterium]
MSETPEERCAFVTGASRGIGAASARALAEDGWAVAVNYSRDEDGAKETVSAIEDAGGRALAVQANVADAEAVATALATAEEEFGPVLGLVNNAGMRADDLLLSLDDEEWDNVLDLNLTSPFKLIRRTLRGMIKARFGRIVNIASVVGPRANAGQANYAAAKAGLVGLTKTAAVEVAHRGVTINAVAPGFVATSLTEDVSDDVFEAIPARRAGTPEEVAACVRFLASEGAAYVTGTTLYVDGGMSA